MTTSLAMKAFGVLLLLQVGENSFATELWLLVIMSRCFRLHVSWALDQHMGAICMHDGECGCLGALFNMILSFHHKPNCPRL
jgi:hypothetical protein